jgi:hypothetical protein
VVTEDQQKDGSVNEKKKPIPGLWTNLEVRFAALRPAVSRHSELKCSRP